MRHLFIGRLGLGGLWTAALSVGLWLMGHYETAPGRAADAPSDWPADSPLPPPAGRPTVLLFAHPHCPCSRASVSELAWVLARAPGRVRAYVVFGVPSDAGDDWQLTPLWEAALRLPYTGLWNDPDGREARRFGAATSGQAVLYDGAGRRLWQGGLTAGRGLTGPNSGRAALLAALTGAGGPDTPVYGCPLIVPRAPCDESDPSCPN